MGPQHKPKFIPKSQRARLAAARNKGAFLTRHIVETVNVRRCTKTSEHYIQCFTVLRILKSLDVGMVGSYPENDVTNCGPNDSRDEGSTNRCESHTYGNPRRWQIAPCRFVTELPTSNDRFADKCHLIIDARYWPRPQKSGC